LKVAIPAIPFARAWEAVSCASADDSDRLVTYRTVLIEHFTDRGLRLVSSDGYLFLRAWVPFFEDEEPVEPTPLDRPDETLLVVDTDHRGIGLLKHVRKQLKKEWRFKAKEEQPDTNPTLMVETRTAPRQQGVLEGMDLPSFYIDYPDHETVALPLLDSAFPDWRQLVPAAGPAVALDMVMLGPVQLGRLARVGKLYAQAPIITIFHGPEHAMTLSVGPIRGLLTPASATSGEDASEDDDEDQISLDDLEDGGDE
jgi:hypothetical protein